MTCRTRLAPAVVCVAVAAMPAVSEPQPAPDVVLTEADVDRTFGQGGRLAPEVVAGLPSDWVSHVRIDRLGRIVLASSPYFLSGLNTFRTPPHVARLNSDGSPDLTFGDGGVVTLPLDGPPQAIAVDEADRVTITGEFRNDSGAIVAAVRLLDAGTPDEEFSSNGFAELVRDPPSDEILASAVAGDGGIVVAERTGTTYSLVRFTAAGEFDPTFGVGGSATLGSEQVAQVVPDDRGGVVVVFGDLKNAPLPGMIADTSVRRISADGTPDPEFGFDGELRWSPEWYAGVRPSSVSLDAQGRLVVLESGYHDMLLGRFLADGTPDVSFSEDGAMPVLVGAPGARSVSSYHLRVAQGHEDRWVVFGGVEFPGGTRGWFAEFFSPSDPLSLAAHVEEQAPASPNWPRIFDADVSPDGSAAIVAGGWDPRERAGVRARPPLVRLDLVGGKRVPLPDLEARWRSVRVRPGSAPLDVRGTLRIVNRGPVRSPPGFVDFEGAGVDPQGELVFRGILVGTAARRRVRALAPGASMTLRYHAERLSGPPFGTYSLRLAAVVVPTGLQGAPEDVVLTPPLGDQ